MKELENKVLDIAMSWEKPWDSSLIDEICQKCDLTNPSFKIAFPKGIETLAELFFKSVDGQMLLAKSDSSYELPIHVQVSNLLKARLVYMMKHRNVSLNVLGIDCSLQFKLQHLHHVSDLIWNNVKHKTEGFDYYTRRMILSYIYKNCLFFFKKRNISEDEMLDFMKQQFKCIGFITKMKKKFCN